MKPNRLANTSRCHGIRRSRRPASGPLMLGIRPAKIVARSASSGKLPCSQSRLRRFQITQESRAGEVDELAGHDTPGQNVLSVGYSGRYGGGQGIGN